jgi:hypothetical protein
MTLSFKCARCDEVHFGIPAFTADAPYSYLRIPYADRHSRCILGTDDCSIDSTLLFVRGNIEISVHGQSSPLIWGVWVQLSEEHFDKWAESYDLSKRSHLGPYPGTLDTWFSPYPQSLGMKVLLHLRDGGIRPRIELEDADHPLVVEQRNGIGVERLAEIYAEMTHDRPN